MLSESREEKLRAQGVPPAIIASMRSFEEQQLERRPARAPSLGPQLSEQPEEQAAGQEPPQASETSHLPSQSVEQAGALESFSNTAQSDEVSSSSSSDQLGESAEERQLEVDPHALQESAAQPLPCAEGDGAPGSNSSTAAMRQSQPEQQSRQSWPTLQSSPHDGQSHDTLESGEGPCSNEQSGLPAGAGRDTTGAEVGDHGTLDCSDAGEYDTGCAKTGIDDTKKSVFWAWDPATEDSDSRSLQEDLRKAPLNQDSEAQR